MDTQTVLSPAEHPEIPKGDTFLSCANKIIYYKFGFRFDSNMQPASFRYTQTPYNADNSTKFHLRMSYNDILAALAHKGRMKKQQSKIHLLTTITADFNYNMCGH